MAETIGSLIDKISIMELKRHYMAQQLERTDADEDHRHTCAQRLEVLTEQRDDLATELDGLALEVITGRRELKVYRQFKMYNDPRYKSDET